MSREKSSGLSVTTLLLASASAAGAALIVPMFWQQGTVVAAAVTPVVVSLVSEALKRPVERVSSVGVWRRTPGGTVVRERGEHVPVLAVDQRSGPREEPFDPLAAGQPDRWEVAPAAREDPFGLREPERGSRPRRRPVLIALVTGLLAFAIAAVVVTASELAIFGDSVSRPQRTTFFGGAPSKAPAEKPKRDTAPAEGTPAPEATATPTPEAGSTPAPSATPAPGGAATPAPSAAPTAVPPIPTP